MKLNTQTFIERAKKVHGNRYDYSRTVYERSTKKVAIICPEHGLFLQRPENHVNQKQHCPKCANTRKGKHDRFSVEWMMEQPEKAYAPALLFVTEVQDKASNYLEVGVSTKSIKHSYVAKPKTTLIHLRYVSLKEALLLKGLIENTLKEHAIDPLDFSPGKTKRFLNHPTARDVLDKILPKNQ